MLCNITKMLWPPDYLKSSFCVSKLLGVLNLKIVSNRSIDRIVLEEFLAIAYKDSVINYYIFSDTFLSLTELLASSNMFQLLGTSFCYNIAVLLAS